jgi:hypothetical protein
MASHSSFGGHVPHMSCLPHPSLAGPHLKPSDAHVIGVQVPHVWVVGLHAWPGMHAPQLTSCPQSFTRTPHVAPSCAHVLPGTMHCLVVELQICVAPQEPQSIIPPQVSS